MARYHRCAISCQPNFALRVSKFKDSLRDLALNGLSVSSVLLPAAFTSFFAGHLAGKVGRQKAIMIHAAIFGVGAALDAGAVSLGIFIPGRALRGVGEGFFLSNAVVYTGESCPPER